MIQNTLINLIRSVADIFEAFCRAVLSKYAYVLYLLIKGGSAKMAAGSSGVIAKAVLL